MTHIKPVKPFDTTAKRLERLEYLMNRLCQTMKIDFELNQLTIQDIDRQLAEKYAYQKLINANIPFTGGQSSAAKEAINANYAKSNAISTKRNNEEIAALLILRDNFLNPVIIDESNIDQENTVDLIEVQEKSIDEPIMDSSSIIDSLKINYKLIIPIILIGGITAYLITKKR